MSLFAERGRSGFADRQHILPHGLMDLPGLTESTIRANASQESFRRGTAYYDEGAVVSLKRKDEQHVEAYVKGGDLVPYAVRIRHDAAGISEVQCTCPYHAGSWCKHVVATLLACLHQPDAGPASIAALLAGLDREALISLIERLVERNPEWAAQIEQESARLR